MSEGLHDRTEASLGRLLLLGPAVGIAVTVCFYVTRDILRGWLLPPWTDLLFEVILVGQGVFAATFVCLIVEWLCVRWRARGVASLRQQDQTTWAGRARLEAITTSHPRPLPGQRSDNLHACKRTLEMVVILRWFGYTVLVLLPGLLGLVLGLRGIALNQGHPVPFMDLFTPLLVGTAEGVLLFFLSAWVFWRQLQLLDAWLKRCQYLEQLVAPTEGGNDPQPVRMPPRPATNEGPAALLYD